MGKNHYQVIMSNVGIVYEGTNGFTAIKEYNSCIALSKNSLGRASGENVELLRNDEIMRIFVGSLEKEIEKECN